MTEEYNQLIKSFQSAIEKKIQGKLDKSDLAEIFDAAQHYFQDDRSIEKNELLKIRDKWVELAGEKIDKGRAMKKLQGTSRAEAIKGVLSGLF